MRATTTVRLTGKEHPCCERVAQLLTQSRGREFTVYLPPLPPRVVRCRYCNNERTVRMYELVHPLRFLGGRRVVWIETGVVELLPPSVAPEQPSEEQS